MTDRTKYLHRPKPGLVYFRYQGKGIRLPADETSDEFAQAYDRLIASIEQPAAVGRPSKESAGSAAAKPRRSSGSSRYRPPQIGWVIEKYLASDFFAPPEKEKPTEKPYSRGTQRAYRCALGFLGKELGEALLLDMNPRTANLYIAKVKRERGTSHATVQKKLLSNLWNFAKDFPEIDFGDRCNPLVNREVKNPYEVRQEHKPWPLTLRERFKAVCGPNLYLAFHLLLCTGQRRGDVAKIKWTQLNEERTHLELWQEKTSEWVPVKLPKILVELLQRTERVAETVLVNTLGRPYAEVRLSQAIKDVLVRIEEADRLESQLTGQSPAIKATEYVTHGLRKNAGILLAEGGATELQIMTALGHRTPAMAQYYIRLANKKRIAEQNADIFDAEFEREKAQVAAARRAAIRRVK